MLPPAVIPGRVIVLNGCSSSGKSSIAAALQRTAEDLQFLHLQLDAFRAMEPLNYFSPQRREQWGLRTAALCHAMNSSVLQFAKHGQNVVVDHVLSPQAWSYLLEDFKDFEVSVVKVFCELEELERRERTRKDRDPGLARSQWSSIHEGRVYDIEFNTTGVAAAEVAASLEGWLRSGARPSAMQVMRQSQNEA